MRTHRSRVRARIRAGVLIGAGLWLVLACDQQQADVRTQAPATPEAPQETPADPAPANSDESVREEAFSRPAVVVDLDVSGGLESREHYRLGRLITGGPVRWGTTLIAGTADGALLAVEIPGGEELWTQRMGETVSALAVDSAAVYAATESALHRMSPATGEVLWRVPVDALPATELTLTRQGLYLGLDTGEILALDPEDGSRRWRSRVNGRPVGRMPLADGLLHLATDSGDVAALEAESGVVAWRENLDAPLEAGPAAAPGVVAVASAAGTVTVLDAEGTQQASWESTPAPVLVPPLLAGDLVIIAGAGGSLAAYDREGGLRWRRELTAHLAGVPAVVGDVLVVSEHTGGSVAVDVRTGEELGRIALGASPGGESALFRDLLYYVLRDGSIRAVAMNAERAEVPLFTSEGIQVLPETGTFRLRDETVSLRMRTERDAVFEISVSTAPREDLVLQVVSERGAVVASNMGKVNLSDTLRVALDAGVSYELRIARPDATGEVTISIETVQLQ